MREIPPAMLKKEHIPVKILASTSKKPVASGVVEHTSVKLWCCFYDLTDDKVKYAWKSIPGCTKETVPMWTALGHLNDYKRTSTNSIYNFIVGKINKKKKQGMETLPGDWYIQPDVGRIFEMSSIDQSHKHTVRMRDVVLHGIPSSNTAWEFDSKATARDRNQPKAGDIGDRLSQVNPYANHWFF